MRLEALKEAHEIMVENFRTEWARYKEEGAYPLLGWDRPDFSSYRDGFRRRARRALANIRAVRLVLGDGRPDRFMLRQVRIRGSFSV